MKIAVGVPSNDHVHADFCNSLICAVSHTMADRTTRLLAVINEKNCNIPMGRCNLVEGARGLGADAIIFIDSDQIFPRDTLTRLASRGKDIIGCNIVQRRSPFQSNVEGLDGVRFAGEKRSGVEEVSRIGTGILFVRLDVFDELQKPYFNFGFEEEKGWTGEDYNFCNAARERGFKIFVDNDLSKEVFHVGTMNYHISMLEPLAHANAKNR